MAESVSKYKFELISNKHPKKRASRKMGKQPVNE
jgi:hypothetical protein